MHLHSVVVVVAMGDLSFLSFVRFVYLYCRREDESAHVLIVGGILPRAQQVGGFLIFSQTVAFIALVSSMRLR